MSERHDEQINRVPDEVERKWYISRRGFLIGMAATGAALALGIPLGLPPLRRAAAGLVLENCRRTNVTGCSILDCDNAGILLNKSPEARVSNCLIRSLVTLK